MAQNDERYRHGPKSIVSVPVESATVIYKGDFVCLDGGYAVPASGLSDAGDAAANRENAADNFLGIAETSSLAGETDPVQVDVSCEAVFKLELQAAATVSFGTALEIYATASAPSAYQTVAGTTSKIATTVEAITSGTSVNCKLLPQVRLHRANPQT
jgi:hypothetical protein